MVAGTPAEVRRDVPRVILSRMFAAKSGLGFILSCGSVNLHDMPPRGVRYRLLTLFAFVINGAFFMGALADAQPSGANERFLAGINTGRPYIYCRKGQAVANTDSWTAPVTFAACERPLERDFAFELVIAGPFATMAEFGGSPQNWPVEIFENLALRGLQDPKTSLWWALQSRNKLVTLSLGHPDGLRSGFIPRGRSPTSLVGNFQKPGTLEARPGVGGLHAVELAPHPGPRLGVGRTVPYKDRRIHEHRRGVGGIATSPASPISWSDPGSL